MALKHYVYCLLILLTPFNFVYAQSGQSVVINRTDEAININSGIEYLEDPGHNIGNKVFGNSNFKTLPPGIPNKNITASAFWFRFMIRNETNASDLVIKLSNPAMDSIDFYEQINPDSFRKYQTGAAFPFSQREYLSTDFIFPVHLLPHAEKYIYLHVSSSTALLLPLTVGTESAMVASDKYKDIFWGIYMGVMLAMLLYNAFVYSTTKDSSYLYYIIYVLAVALTQITISGFGFQLLWPHNTLIAKYSSFVCPVFVGIAAIAFIRRFLKTNIFLPKSDQFFAIGTAAYSLGLALVFAGNYRLGLNIIDLSAGILSLFVLTIGIIIGRKGYRPAIFFVVAWIVFLLGIFIFVFKNFNILPYNDFTVYTMPFGSALEVILLSFALADQINILKKEVEQSQAKELKALHENERIVLEQNLLLEGKVTERTFALKLSNDELNKALEELKDAQANLVESEKMASLGQFTAGIAHEMNNPLNFVTSQIKPLNRDVHILLAAIGELEIIVTEDIPVAEIKEKLEKIITELDYGYLETEMNDLLKGIGDGATRTAEILKGLRSFSRLDEDTLKLSDINEGLESTLVFTHNLFSDSITLDKQLGKLPLVDCYAGKLNQVFFNVISNAVYAINKKFGTGGGGQLTIKTYAEGSTVFIRISDNGVGMSENTKKRMFDPFFTTKDVGEGMGLGLSTAYKTVNSHNGQILVSSTPGNGSDFLIKLPLQQKTAS